MTECNIDPVIFSCLKRHQVVADFDGGAITSDAGAVLLREADRSLGLIDRLDAAIPDPRSPALIIHQQATMLRQRIFAIAQGHEDGNDHQHLRDDPMMQLATGRGIDPNQPLASPPTLCRLENRVDRSALFNMAKALVETFIASFDAPPSELILDFDATDDQVHGHQVGRFFHGYYNGYCFLPLYVFCGHRLLVAYLRPANIDAATHAWAILAMLVKRFRQAWPGVKVTFRGDSGFCRWKMLRWCERHHVSYVVGIARNSRLESMAQPLMQQARELFEKQQGDRKPTRVFGDLAYEAKTWDKARRVIVKAERLGGEGIQQPKDNNRFIVTNLNADARALYEDFYCQRGEAENRIKEQQLGLFAGRTSCHDFEANQWRVMLSAAAYVLIQHIREKALADTELAKAQVTTIRLKLLKIGGLVQRTARRVVLRLSSSCPMQMIFRIVARKLIALPDSA